MPELRPGSRIALASPARSPKRHGRPREPKISIVTTTDTTPRIAVAIPCFNEAAAISAVIARWREALPIAEIIVFDNNSTDGTGAVARNLGVRVIDVPDQGKGYAVRAAFSELADRDALILVDGDGTYPADYAAALALAGPRRRGRHDRGRGGLSTVPAHDGGRSLRLA